ncbi:MAG: DUF1295 domain-containing protein [Promethearchaeota archaeon]
MSEDIIFDWLMIGFTIIAVIVFISLFFITAPYGQHIEKFKNKNSRRWFIRVQLNDKLAWFIMEVPTVIIYIALFLIGGRTDQIIPRIFLIIWLIHYGQRSFIFPFLLRGTHKMPISIMIIGMLFNGMNTYLQARWVNTLSVPYRVEWLLTPAFITGVIIFLCGFIINIHSDHIIRKLRKAGDNNFYVPYGGMFRFISCPSYFGEITEWIGWAILTWSYPGLIFAFWTFSNLFPRARSTHKWYLETFPGYPKDRKALIPFIF